MKLVVEITDNEQKALLTQMTSIEEWINGIVRQRINHCIDQIVEEYSDKQARKLTDADKLAIIESAKVEPLQSVEKLNQSILG